MNSNKNNIVKILLVLVSAFGIGMWRWNGFINSELYTGGVATQEQTVNEDENIQACSVSVEINDGEKVLNDAQAELLAGYARSYADTLCSLNPADVLSLFTDENENYHINKAAWEILTEIRKMSHMDLTLEKAEITYTVVETRVSGDTLKIHITENNLQKFRHMQEDSCSYNINHLFVLQQSDDGWKIKSHEQEEDFFLLAIEGWEDATGETYDDKLRYTVKIITDDARENKEELKISTGNPPEDIAVKNIEYNRDAAVEYARQWCNKRNYEDGYLAYDAFGGNCQNFASQCIYAGGIAMDHSGYGESQWKFYSQTLNTKQAASGRSYSWTGVDPFYTYATINRSSGMVCQADLQLEYAEKGDVIQVGAYHDWRHSLVVIDVMKDSDGNLQDIIVASNTADRWNYPLSAYIYTYPRLIHIIGQN
ncbi:MAG: amidase domain-containing protein [Oscillospiraceae bacterium]|nr:amidase domain-containing protein [Oscillospiraceae bacterium]